MAFLIQIAVRLLVAIRFIGAAIEIFTDKNQLECGRNLTLTCKVENYTSALAWMAGNDEIPIAHCLRNSCSLNTSYMKKYTFTYDIDEGVFNLTIIKLTMKDIGRAFMCSNGFDSVSHEISFRDYKTQLVVNELTGLCVIIATVACVSNETEVQFKWFKIDATNNFESEFIPKILFDRTEQCSDGFICGNSTHIQRSEVISANPTGTKKYYLKIVLVSGNETIESQRTLVEYNLEEQGMMDECLTSMDCYAVYEGILVSNCCINILFWVIGSVVLLLLTVLIVSIIWKRNKQSKRRNSYICKKTDDKKTICSKKGRFFKDAKESINLTKLEERKIDDEGEFIK